MVAPRPPRPIPGSVLGRAWKDSSHVQRALALVSAVASAAVPFVVASNALPWWWGLAVVVVVMLAFVSRLFQAQSAQRDEWQAYAEAIEAPARQASLDLRDFVFANGMRGDEAFLSCYEELRDQRSFFEDDLLKILFDETGRSVEDHRAVQRLCMRMKGAGVAAWPTQPLLKPEQAKNRIELEWTSLAHELARLLTMALDSAAAFPQPRE